MWPAYLLTCISLGWGKWLRLIDHIMLSPAVSGELLINTWKRDSNSNKWAGPGGRHRQQKGSRKCFVWSVVQHNRKYGILWLLFFRTLQYHGCFLLWQTRWNLNLKPWRFSFFCGNCDIYCYASSVCLHANDTRFLMWFHKCPDSRLVAQTKKILPGLDSSLTPNSCFVFFF